MATSWWWNRIIRASIILRPTANWRRNWASTARISGQFGMPRAAAVNKRGEIYVCEYTLSERVQRFTAYGKKCLGSFGKLGDGPGEFSRAEGIGIDEPGPYLCGRFLQSSHSDF